MHPLSQGSHMARWLAAGGAAALMLTEPKAEATPEPEESKLPELVGSTNWRQNFQLAQPDMEASPLPTRQLRRMAARDLARAVSSVQKIEERKLQKLNRKRRRATEAYNAHQLRHTSSE